MGLDKSISGIRKIQKIETPEFKNTLEKKLSLLRIGIGNLFKSLRYGVCFEENVMLAFLSKVDNKIEGKFGVSDTTLALVLNLNMISFEFQKRYLSS